METKDIWAMLEEKPPYGCDAVQDLYSWSLNYDAGKGPFTLFIDLIGYTLDEFGETFYRLSDASLGYVELDKLGLALREYANDPNVVSSFVRTLIEAEMES